MAVAGTVLAAVVAMIGWVVWSYVSGPKQSELVEVQPYSGGRYVGGGNRVAPRPVNLDGVRQQAGNNYFVRAGEVMLSVRKGPSDSSWQMVMNYNRPDLLNPDQTAALTARFRLSTDAAFAKSLKVTDEQLAKLRQIPPATNAALSSDNQQRLKDAWEKWVNASDKAGPEQELLKSMREIGAASLDATKQQIDQRVKQVQEILTPEQIAAFKQ
jgi:hypothetical protein